MIMYIDSVKKAQSSNASLSAILSDSDTNSKSHANTNTDTNSYANSYTDSQPNAYADSGAWNYRRESRGFRATGKSQL